MIHEPGCQCGAYACELRSKGVQVAAIAGQPSRANRVPPAKSEPPGHWKNILYDERPNGTKMPIINGKTGDVIRHKEATEKQYKIKDQLARAKAGK